MRDSEDGVQEIRSGVGVIYTPDMPVDIIESIATLIRARPDIHSIMVRDVDGNEMTAFRGKLPERDMAWPEKP
ncbi:MULTISPECIES: hypothetical protein [Alphaproteobacteria]|jgi:hypothetical protein|uniref:Uncharacterized protein n=2 Tax=Alphaproteobacteria TaxID=28211 RepID=A0A512HNI6_9HYPH|nr:MULTISPECIES: hypothetical protein [Alphaproteobacteria]GEO86960.1 hypothetical protein RNA01_38920 [Ciceribacter naphthalenivorans]GLR23302.1 hypothetical protein GCM10007920_30910 [Ciceribacter naphthalenivorans]GLT06158.1 hypothetical protein GCM10007926_30910 [Sphingomonas psychrolutea]